MNHPRLFSSLACALLMALPACKDTDSDRPAPAQQADPPAPKLPTPNLDKMPLPRPTARGHMSPDVHAARLQTTLGLSAEQTQRIEVLLNSERSLRAKQQSIKAELEPAQLARYEEMLQKRPRRRRDGSHRRGHKNPAAHTDRLQREFGLSDSQKGQLLDKLRHARTRAERQAAIEAVFTAEQLARYRQARPPAATAPAPPAGSPATPPPPRPQSRPD